jgi:hypothetical protein
LVRVEIPLSSGRVDAVGSLVPTNSSQSRNDQALNFMGDTTQTIYEFGAYGSMNGEPR